MTPQVSNASASGLCICCALAWATSALIDRQSHYGLNVAGKPPTAKQLALLRKLAVEKNQTFAEPQTSWEASEQISRLMALGSAGYWKNRRTSRAGSSRSRAKNVG